MEKNIIKLMQATLGEVEFTDAVFNRISQRLNDKRQAAALQALSEQLPLFPEIGLLENPKPAIEAELEVSNFLWDFLSTIVASKACLRVKRKEIPSEEQMGLEKPSPSQLTLPGFESKPETFHHTSFANGSEHTIFNDHLFSV